LGDVALLSTDLDCSTENFFNALRRFIHSNTGIVMHERPIHAIKIPKEKPTDQLTLEPDTTGKE
jgi:hypothetical protein